MKIRDCGECGRACGKREHSIFYVQIIAFAAAIATFRAYRLSSVSGCTRL